MENLYGLDSLLPYLEEKAESRFLLGITGSPGSGKSTVAQLIRDLLCARGRRCVVVPMDGFHFSNEELEKTGLRQLKGIPASFDAEGFFQLVKDIRAYPLSRHLCPLFDRSIEASIPNAICVSSDDRLVIIEGNYLLLQTPPWVHLRELLDETWFIDCPMEVLEPRLLRRHINGGMSEEQARIKAESTDIPNARLIDTTRNCATRIITLVENRIQCDGATLQ